MIELGKIQSLEASRISDYGMYLREPGTEAPEVLLPCRYVPEDLKPGQCIEVFVYKDSEDRPVATTERPYVMPGEFAYLQVAAVNKVGAFLDWGLPKDLLVPYSEQKSKMRRGGIYLVYVYVDKTSGRIVASAKIDKFLGNVFPDYKPMQKVQALVTEHNEIGYKVIVDNLHRGMIYSNEIFSPIEVEQSVTAYVKRVRDDGKIDLTLGARAKVRTNELTAKIIEYLRKENGPAVGDKSDPELISRLFGCSKKDFKQAVGHLYKERKIEITPEGHIRLPR